MPRVNDVDCRLFPGIIPYRDLHSFANPLVWAGVGDLFLHFSSSFSQNRIVMALGNKNFISCPRGQVTLYENPSVFMRAGNTFLAVKRRFMLPGEVWHTLYVETDVYDLYFATHRE